MRNLPMATAHSMKSPPEFCMQESGAVRGVPATCELITVQEDEIARLKRCAPSYAHVWVQDLESYQAR